MTRKKSAKSKVKTRKQAYQRNINRLKANRSWKTVILTIKAVKKFLNLRNRNRNSCNSLQETCISEESLNGLDDKQIIQKDVEMVVCDVSPTAESFEDIIVVKNVVEKIVSKICRLECERKRQSKNREKKNRSKTVTEKKSSIAKLCRQNKWFKRKYYCDSSFCNKKKEQARKYSKKNYQSKNEFGVEKRKEKIACIVKKYHNNANFRDIVKARSKNYISNKYYNDKSFADKVRFESKIYKTNKYHHDEGYRDEYKKRIKVQTLNRYKSNNLIRLKTIQSSLESYRNNSTRVTKNRRQLYNRERRRFKKYIADQNHTISMKDRNLYINNLIKFRKIIKEGPDFVCISCQLALFRNQVIPFVKKKYIQENMTDEMKTTIESYFAFSSIRSKNWICISCSEKIKKKKMPCRAVVNQLNVSEIPIELKKLNDLEKHLIALRLPFIKIVNLTSGNISSRLAQKGAKGPLHCVPSDVQDTVTMLPRPVDRSMMVRLQLKRRLNYKAVWEEQFINPSDIRDALHVLRMINPAYKNINISEINENYLISDQENNNEENVSSLVGAMEIDIYDEDNITEQVQASTENLIGSLALGDVDKCDSLGEEINEDDRDIRTKYTMGTDSCIQPCDFNDLLVFDRKPYAVAPGEKNKLCSLLTDKTIEALAFPYLFPDGQGSYDEDRISHLDWKEYCKIRLFSSDSRFASDSKYIFFIQYLGDLKQIYSGINVAFRKKLPMNAKQSLDETQMKFLMNKDMIYRHLQCVRGSPQYWSHRLKDLFAMTRQLGFPSFFITLSSADLRWKEFTDTFIRHVGSESKELYTFEEKSKLLRANPVLAVRMFERRLNNFMNLFVKGGAWCLGKIVDWFIRIEMQSRGSPHAHSPLWVQDAPKYIGPQTDEKTREEIVKFCDRYIMTRYPSQDEDPELFNIVKDVQTHSRNHSKTCLKYHNTMCRFGFPRPVSRRTFICEPIKVSDEDEKENVKKIKRILTEMNAIMNTLEKEKTLLWFDFDDLLNKYNWTYENYERALRVVHTRPVIIHKREPNARWINQYNEEMLRAWNANMDIQFILDPYACAKYLMSYTTKPEREMSMLLEETHKECREGNMSVREEMKKLTGTFFTHRQVSVQEAIYRATKMPLTYSSRGCLFVPAHSNSCKFLKSTSVLKQMDANDENIYMPNLADKYFDRPLDTEYDICMADFASNYEIKSIRTNTKNPRESIKRLQTFNFSVKKRCNRNAIIRYPYFNRELEKEDYYENFLCLYLPIRNRNDLKRPYELFYHVGEVVDNQQHCMRKVKDIVHENQKKYEAHFKETDDMISLFNESSAELSKNEWAEVVANKEKSSLWLKEINGEDNPDLNIIHNKKSKNVFVDLKQSYCSTNDIRPLLESMNEEQQKIFYCVQKWCVARLQNPDVEPLYLFITGGAGTGKSHLLKCLYYEATKIFSRKKQLEPDENIDEIHTLITAFTGAAAVNVGGMTIHSAFGIGTQLNSFNNNLSCDKLNSYRCKLNSLKLLFVDEVSLIQERLWATMHSRLTQIMGINSNSIIFGNVSIIAIGDFFQCAPVASASVYSSLLWSSYFKYVELKVNERQKTNKSFSEMLNRIRKLKRKDKMSDEDQCTLEQCHQRFLNKEYHPEALHLFAKNMEVDEHNEKMIKQICSNIRTFQELDRMNKVVKTNSDIKSTKLINKPLQLAINARVMIIKNICVNDGLANGVTGRVISFVEDEKLGVSHVIIKCDSLTIGRLHRISCPHCKGKDTVCVKRESNTNDIQDCDSQSQKEKNQFPLRLSWAMTIHKAQGITVDQVVVSTKDFFGSGMAYTALSRVRTLNGLFLMNLHLDKFYCNQNVDKMILQMKEIEIEMPLLKDTANFVNILFHNIENLSCNFNALKNHHITKKSDFICLVETWFNDKIDIDKFHIDGYHLIHKPRCYSFSENHVLHSQKGGGVALYYRNSIPIQNIDLYKYSNLENTTFQIEKYNIFIVICYRSPKQRKNEFLSSLTNHLKKIGIERRIILIADFNENTLTNKSKPIEMKLNTLGFKNLFKDLPTTNSLTSIDSIYLNFNLNETHFRNIIPTYYSFHNALFLSVETNENSTNRSINCEINIDQETNTKKNSQNSFLNSEVTKNRAKRKRCLKKDHSSKKLKKTFSFATIPYPSNRMKEKQLDFLRNLDNFARNESNKKKSDTHNLKEQLANIGLKKKLMLADGNCFFRAISHQLYGHQNNHLEIRAATINYLIQNKNDFAPFITNMNLTIENYIESMSRNGTYADHVIVTATAVTTNKNIIIHELDHQPLLIPGSDFIQDQLNIAYCPHKLHYDSVVRFDGNMTFLPSESLLFT